MSAPVHTHLGAEGFRASSTTRSLAWVADQPVSVGGADEGPTPEELLLSALGGCTAQTLRMVATRRGMPLTSVDVELSYAFVEGQHQLTRHIRLGGDLTEEQTAKLLEIANKCPVHRILTGNPTVTTDLVRV